MKYVFCTLILVVLLATPAMPQDETVPNMPDTIKRQVVGRIVKYYFKPRRRPTTVYFTDENVKAEWFPTIRNINFVIRDRDNESNETYEAHRITILNAEGERYSIGFGFGDIGIGGGSGKTWTAIATPSSVRLWPDGGGFGWASCAGDEP